MSASTTPPVTLGIMLGYVVGKPVGIVGATWLAGRISGGRLRPPVGWASVFGLLIATLAFRGIELREAKIGILSAAVSASALAWVGFRATRMLPERLRVRAVMGTAQPLVDLAVRWTPDAIMFAARQRRR